MAAAGTSGWFQTHNEHRQLEGRLQTPESVQILAELVALPPYLDPESSIFMPKLVGLLTRRASSLSVPATEEIQRARGRTVRCELYM